MLESLEKLCRAFGPSGIEDEVREIIIDEIKDYADSYEIDAVGNLIIRKKGKINTGKTILFSAHMDEVGFMMRYISEDGYIYIEEIGGVESSVTGGRRLIIGDNRIHGLVCAKAIHLQKAEERGVCIPIDEMYVDIGCENRESAAKLIEIGDCAVFEPNFEKFGDGMIKSKAIDDRAGVAVLIDMIKSELPCDCVFAFVTCEENGLRGSIPASFTIRPDIAVVIEATTAADIPGTPEGEECCKVRSGAVLSFMDSGTIYDKGLFKLACEAMKSSSVQYQTKNFIAGGNDSRAYQQFSGGSRVAAISVPVRYLHSACSVAAVKDIEAVEEAALVFLNAIATELA